MESLGERLWEFLWKPLWKPSAVRVPERQEIRRRAAAAPYRISKPALRPGLQQHFRSHLCPSANSICGGMFSSSRNCPGDAFCNLRFCTWRQAAHLGGFAFMGSRTTSSGARGLDPASLVTYTPQEYLPPLDTGGTPRRRRKRVIPLTPGSRSFRCRPKRTIVPKPSSCRPISNLTAMLPCRTSLPLERSFQPFRWMRRQLG